MFPGPRVAAFIDGCYWHRCPLHGTEPRTNSAYWHAKLDRNVTRDRQNDADLAGRGWAVLRFWEHDDPVVVADRIAKVVRERRTA